MMIIIVINNVGVCNLVIILIVFCLIYEVDVFFMVFVVNDNWNNVFDKEIYIIMMEIVWREW